MGKVTSGRQCDWMPGMRRDVRGACYPGSDAVQSVRPSMGFRNISEHQNLDRVRKGRDLGGLRDSAQCNQQFSQHRQEEALAYALLSYLAKSTGHSSAQTSDKHVAAVGE